MPGHSARRRYQCDIDGVARCDSAWPGLDVRSSEVAETPAPPMLTLRYPKWVSSFDKCPQCRNRTKSSTETVIEAASSFTRSSFQSRDFLHEPTIETVGGLRALCVAALITAPHQIAAERILTFASSLPSAP